MHDERSRSTRIWPRAALHDHPEAEAVWDRLPTAHRRGHAIAIERLADADERAEQVDHTIDHLLVRHAS